jgi:hypothetical protein
LAAWPTLDQILAIASHKVTSVGHDASRHCARRPGGPDRDANSVLASTQTDQDGPFVST